MQRNHRLYRLIVDSRRDRDWPLRARRNDDGISVYLDLRLGVPSGLQACVPKERVVKVISIAVGVFELRQPGRVRGINDPTILINRETILVGDQIKRRGVGQVECGAAITQRRHCFELHRVRIG